MAAESSSRSRSSSSPERTERHCKVRFEGSTQQSESPRSKWRRLGRLTLLRQGRNHKAQPVPQSPVPVGLTTSEEEESSSNSTPTPNLANGRLQAGRGTEGGLWRFRTEHKIGGESQLTKKRAFPIPNVRAFYLLF